MSDLNIDPTQRFFKYLGLIENGKNIYKKSIDLDGDGEEDENEVLDKNGDQTVDTMEVWEFIAANRSHPSIKVFIDTENLYFPIEIKTPPKEISFLDVFSFEIELAILVTLGYGSIKNTQLPHPVYREYLPIFDKKGAENSLIYENGNPIGLNFQTKIYLYSILGVGAGVQGSASNKEEKQAGMIQKGYQLLAPIAELRLPLGDEDFQFVPFARYSRAWGNNELSIERGIPDQYHMSSSNTYKIGELNRKHIFDFGVQFLFAEIFGIKISASYSPFEIENSQAQGKYTFPEWTLGVTILDFMIGQGGKKTLTEF